MYIVACMQPDHLYVYICTVLCVCALGTCVYRTVCIVYFSSVDRTACNTFRILMHTSCYECDSILLIFLRLPHPAIYSTV